MVKDRKDCEEILVNAASSDPGPIYWPGPGTSQCDDDLPLNGSKVCPTHTTCKDNESISASPSPFLSEQFRLHHDQVGDGTWWKCMVLSVT